MWRPVAAANQAIGSHALEPLLFYMNYLSRFGLHSNSQFFQLVCELVSIKKIDWRSTAACCFLNSRRSECSRCDEQSFVCATNHCASEISYFARPDRTFISFALEENMKT